MGELSFFISFVGIAAALHEKLVFSAQEPGQAASQLKACLGEVPRFFFPQSSYHKL